jgi:hypothetical protein
MTSTDVGLTVETFWSNTHRLPGTPLTQLSFHNALLLSAIGGFRPGTVRTLHFWQFAVAALRNPKNREETQIVVTVNIMRNKVKEKSKTGRSKHGERYVEYPF